MTAFLLTTILVLAPTAADDDQTAARRAVEKALPLILKSTAEYPNHRACFSCHHQAVPVLALRTAKEHGFAVEADAIAGPVEHTEADLRGAIEGYRKGQAQPGGGTRAGYAMFTLDVGGYSADELTEAVVAFLLKRDDAKGYWESSSNRPPSEASDFATTYLALRALSAYGKPDHKDRISERTAQALRWLESAKAGDTEDRVFRLLALKAAAAPDESIRKASDALLATRRDDGGWSQLDGGESDAYATGSALFALHRAGGLATDDPAYRKAMRFLIASQREDGSWFVHSRSKPFQPYFESGFPYGKDQFISMAASSWATAALAQACPKP